MSTGFLSTWLMTCLLTSQMMWSVLWSNGSRKKDWRFWSNTRTIWEVDEMKRKKRLRVVVPRKTVRSASTIFPMMVGKTHFLALMWVKSDSKSQWISIRRRPSSIGNQFVPRFTEDIILCSKWRLSTMLKAKKRDKTWSKFSGKNSCLKI